MATAPGKPPLHNFPLSFLKWGTNKNNAAANNAGNHHRYRRPASAEPASEPDSESDRTHSNTNRVGSSRATRHCLSLIPCSENTKRHKSEEREREEEEEESEEADKAAEVLQNQKPWNLRPRRARATTSFTNTSAAGVKGEPHEPEGPNRRQSEVQQQPKSMRLRGLVEGGGGGCQSVEKKEKRKCFIALSKEEIEEDIFVMTGSRPSRRPKRRPKIVQKQLDSIFPGLWLVGVTADAYKGADSP